jgi:hypothetical protein
MMQQRSIVLEAEVRHAGQTHKAAYYVEGDVVHARVGNRVLVAPLSGGEADDRVKSLLLGHLISESRRAGHAARWRERLSKVGGP